MHSTGSYNKISVRGWHACAQPTTATTTAATTTTATTTAATTTTATTTTATTTTATAATPITIINVTDNATVNMIGKAVEDSLGDTNHPAVGGKPLSAVERGGGAASDASFPSESRQIIEN